LRTTGLRRGAAVTVEGLVLGYVGRDVGWYGGGKGFDVGGIGGFRRDKRPSWKLASARSIASSKSERLEEGGGDLGEGAVAIAAAAGRLGL